MVDYRQGLAILDMVVYLPALVMALTMGWRHGFGRQSGWFFFILFSLARLIGNGCYLGTINDPTNVNLYIAYAVCNSVGLSPLLLGLLYALVRVNDSIQRKTGSAYWPTIFRVIGLFSLVAMILSIVGMTSNTSSLQAGYTSNLTRTGVILYLVTWVLLSTMVVLLWFRFDGIEKGEHRLLWAVTVCVPILLIRLVYSFLSIYKHNSTFNMFSGNATVFLVMDVLEEIFVVYIVMITGLTLQQRERPTHNHDADKERQNNAPSFGEAMQYQDVASQESTGQQNAYDSGVSARKPKRKLRGGPIMMLIIFIMNTVERRT